MNQDDLSGLSEILKLLADDVARVEARLKAVRVWLLTTREALEKDDGQRPLQEAER